MTFEEWLADEIEEAVKKVRVTHQDAMNSFAAGYETGYLDALRHVQAEIEGKNG